VQLSVAHVVAHVVARSVARGHAKQVPRDHCSACRVQIDHPADVARHNIECAATGERSYPGHRYYQAIPTLRETLSVDAERLRGIYRANGIAVDGVGVLAERSDVYENGWRRGANN